MKDSKLEILPSVTLNIILESAKLMLKDNLLFTDQSFAFPINDFENLILNEKIRIFGVYDIANKKRIGILDFSKNHCFKLQTPRKIFWKLKLDKYNQEKKGKIIVNILNALHSEVRVQLIVKGNK